MNDLLLSRVEDAGLNASAPPQQRWLDGWLVRLSAGKAKRARCVNAVAEGRVPLGEKLALARELYHAAELPFLVRITPYTLPAKLDAELASRGMTVLDDTRVMVLPQLATLAAGVTPRGFSLHAVGHEQFAQQVGQLRGSPLAQRQAHGQRLALSPVPFEGRIVRRDADGAIVACGQFAVEAELAGLYDVYTAADARGRGLAGWLCGVLLGAAAARGATVGYLQVDGDNTAARRVYTRLGFRDTYRYHYRAEAA